MCVNVCECVCEARESGVPFVSSLHFSSSQVDGVCPLPGPAAVQPCFQEPRSKGRETSPSTHDAPRVREGGHQWGKCWCPSAGCNSGGFREEVTPHRPPLSHSYQGPLGQDGKGPSEAWSRTHEGPKGGVTFKSKKQAGGEGQGNSSYTHAASRTVVGCPQSRWRWDFQTSPTVTAQGSHHPGPMGGRIAKQSRKPTCTGGFPGDWSHTLGGAHGTDSGVTSC